MPIYEYLCTSCGYEFEEVQKFNDPSLEECPDCGKNNAKRQVSMSSFHLKGGGWYKDGYLSNGSETGKIEKKEKDSSTAKETPATDKLPDSEKSTTSEKKESTSTKTSETLSKEKAA